MDQLTAGKPGMGPSTECREGDREALVAFGRENEEKVLADAIRAEMKRVFGEQIRTARWWRRIWIRRRIEREVRRTLGELRPPETLYAHS